MLLSFFWGGVQPLPRKALLLAKARFQAPCKEMSGIPTAQPERDASLVFRSQGIFRLKGSQQKGNLED